MPKRIIKPKEKSVAKLKKEAWAIFSRWIRERDNWTCYTCGKRATGSSMHAGHFVSRRFNNTLFDEHNVHAQCYNCNFNLKGSSGEYSVRLIKDYGLEEHDAIVIRGRLHKQWTPQELIAIKEKYKLITTNEKEINCKEEKE